MKQKPVKVSVNPKLDAVWETIPQSDRYVLDGKRYAMRWRDGKGELMPLAEFVETD